MSVNRSIIPPAYQQQAREREQAIAGLIALLAAMSEHAHDIARHRRTMYLAYLQAGFTETQALDLAKASAI